MNITTPDSYLHDAKTRKRRPGRPKGTGKKVKERILSPKRPVGRPRRDGLPSGSVTVRAKRVVIQLDDDWSKSSQSEPDTFLSSLVVALSALPPPASSGPTAEEAFVSHLNSLAPTSAHNQHLPTLYSILKTFWLPTSPAYFSLTASASARTLSDHRFFYWDPQPLVFNGISCPSCSSPLHNEGRIKLGPLKIYDVERPFFIIGAEYGCKTEGKSFASTDPSILRALPAKLRDELPVKLVHADKDVGSDENIWCWKPAGVSKTLWNLVLGCVRGGLTKDMIVQLIRDTQKGVQEVEIAEQSRSSNPNEGFTDAYSDAWTANIATANEDDDAQTQQPDPPTQSYNSYDQTKSSTSISYFPSTSIRFKPYEYGPISTSTQALSVSVPENTILHTVTPPARHQSSQSSALTAGSSAMGPDHSLPQLQTPSSSSSRLSPSSHTVTPILAHSSVAPPPVPSTSSTVQRPSNTYPRVQQPLLSSSSNSMNTFSKHVFNYPTLTNYSAHEPQSQGQHQTQHSQSHSQVQIHNPYQQTHTSLTAAHDVSMHTNGLTRMSVVDSSHSHTDGINLNGQASPGPSMSTLSGVSIFHGSSSANPGPSSSSPTPVPPVPISNSATTTTATPLSNANESAKSRQRNPRHCSKCGSTSCKGKGGRSYCTNVCKDCGKYDCRGRNSRRPEKNCKDGWSK
ncbi:hypothetical protein J3R30DRAFT_3507398 [Lentinula aciculospora]|uniref:Uncharacterized protein n=1 Tax=Lentinula aciculospora TaxID=153920 RepID=A0A9W9A5Z3_9AGAR|nr:hypothetical protein J3R30DRAFT_3507398 [Lentinula aciculospora]